MRGKSDWCEDDPRDVMQGRSDIVVLVPVGHTFWDAHMAQLNHRSVIFFRAERDKPGAALQSIHDGDSWPDGWSWILAPLRD